MTKIRVPRTFIIGLGGTGALALHHIKEQMLKTYLHPDFDFPLVRFLAIDTEMDTAAKQTNIRSKYLQDREVEIKLAEDEKFYLKVTPTNVQNWLRHPENLLADDFSSEKDNDNMIVHVAGAGAGGFGMVGKIVLWDNLDKLKGILLSKIQNLINLQETDQKLISIPDYRNQYEPSDGHINIFVICSTGGGTGRGTFLSIGVMIREILKRISDEVSDNAEIMLINYMPSCFSVTGRLANAPYIHANEYAAFKEIEATIAEYPLEKKMRGVLDVPEAQKFSKQIYNNIFMVAANMSTGQLLGHYQSLDTMVAEFICSYVFGNLFETYRIYLRSNKGNFIANKPLTHNFIQIQKPIRDYGRIGRYKLVMPLQQLHTFAYNYFAEKLLDDVLQGSLLRYYPTQMNPNEFANELYTKTESEIAAAPKRTVLEEVTPGLDSFEDNWIAKLVEAINGIVQKLEYQYKKQENGLSNLEIEAERLVNKEIQDLKTALATYLYIRGIKNTIQFIREYIQKLELLVQADFQSELQEIKQQNKVDNISFEEDLDPLVGYVDSRIKELFKKLETDKLAGIEEIRKQINSCRENWEKKNKAFFKLLFGTEPKSLDDDTKQLMRQLLDNNYATCKKLHDQIENLGQLMAIDLFHKQLKLIIETLEHNEELIQKKQGQKIVGGLIKWYEVQKLGALEKKPELLEYWIIQPEESEFEQYANELKIESDQRSPLERLHTDREWQKFQFEIVTRKLREISITSQLDNLISNYQFDAINSSICGYLRKLIDQGREKEVKEYFHRLTRNADFLGVLDLKRISGGTQSGQIQKILMIENQKDFERFVSDPEVSITQNNRLKEEIILIQLETALPLFVFQEMHLAQTKYKEVVRNAIDPEKALYEKHTHKHFTHLPEPFGPPIEGAGFLNLIAFLQHLGLMRFEENQKVQLRRKGGIAESDWKYLLLPDRGDGLTEEERKTDAELFKKKFNHEQKWFDQIIELIADRFKVLMNNEHKKANKAQLTKYLVYETDVNAKGFPYLPSIFFQYFIVQNDNYQIRQWLLDHQSYWVNKRKRLQKREDIFDEVSDLRFDLVFDAPIFQW
jgi:hypothetical protein